MQEMSEFIAVVENGRINVEVDYPDGTEVTVNVESGDPHENMDLEERKALNASLKRGLEQIERGECRLAEDVIADLRARRAAR